MVIFCPSCRKSLRLPEGFRGKSVRCPGCQQVFTAPAETGGEIQAAAPKAPAHAVEPSPPTTRKRRRLEEDDYDDEDDDLHDEGEDEARTVAKRGAIFLIFAGAATIVARLVGLVAAFLIDVDLPAEFANDRAFQFGRGLGAFLCGGLTVGLVVFMFVGANNLLNLRSRGLVITGAIMCFVLAGLDLMCWIGVNVLGMAVVGRGQATRGMYAEFYVKLAAGVIIVVVNLTAGIMALLASNHTAVRDAMNSRRRPRRRRRRD